MKKAFLFLLLATAASATAFAQSKPKKRPARSPSVIIDKEIKVPAGLFDDVFFDIKSTGFSWVNSDKDTLLLPGQLLSSDLDLAPPGGQPAAILRTVCVADTIFIRKDDDALYGIGTPTEYAVAREGDEVTLIHPETGGEQRFRLLRDTTSNRINGMQDLDNLRTYRPAPPPGPPLLPGQ